MGFAEVGWGAVVWGPGRGPVVVRVAAVGLVLMLMG